MPYHPPATLPATLLVPGWHDTETALEAARHRLLSWGWREDLVRCLGFRDRHGSNVQHAAELAAAIEPLAQATECGRVAVVAHSMGGLALRQYLSSVSPHRVHTAIFVGTPHYGTWAAYLAWGDGGVEMRPGSRFLRRLNAQPLPDDLVAHCIHTPIDTRVLPGSSAMLAGVRSHRVLLPTHPRMLRHGRTLALIRDLLAAANPASSTAPDQVRPRSGTAPERTRTSG